MPAAKNVNPQKWSDLTVLFDNGTHSVASGRYEGDPAIGIRWNGAQDPENDPGFPNQGGNPTWHVVPDILEKPILKALLSEEVSGDVKGGMTENDVERLKAVLDELAD